jgi:hypothetical protein
MGTALTVAFIGFGLFAIGFLIASLSLVRAFFTDFDMDTPMRGFAIGFMFAAPGALLMWLSWFIGGAALLARLGLLDR